MPKVAKKLPSTIGEGLNTDVIQNREESLKQLGNVICYIKIIILKAFHRE